MHLFMSTAQGDRIILRQRRCVYQQCQFNVSVYFVGLFYRMYIHAYAYSVYTCMYKINI